MIKTLTKLGSFAAAVALTTSAHALTTMSISMGPPIVNGNTAQIDVVIDFTDDDQSHPNPALVFFAIDFTSSDPALTSGGNDFTRFSFTKSSPLLDNWDQIFFFGPNFFDSAVGFQVDTSLVQDGLLDINNPHLIGTLNVNLAGLAPGDYAVAIDSLLSFGFYEPDLSVGDPNTSEFVDIVDPGNRAVITVAPNGDPSVPEPATMALGIMGLAALATRRRRA